MSWPQPGAVALAYAELLWREIWAFEPLTLTRRELRRLYVERSMTRVQVEAAADLLADQGSIKVTAGPLGVVLEVSPIYRDMLERRGVVAA